jgi:GMP synthase-like glutamine amidotransferase
MTRALVVEHIVEEGAGAFAEWLPAAGLDLDTHRVHVDGPPPATLPDGYDALVVMGGSMGVPDADTTHPWLHGELALIREAVGRGVPVLGVCLGAQLLAAACGGTVRRGRLGPELGVCRVHLTTAAENDPLLAGLPAITNVVQWHWDEIFALPPGAVHLAASPTYPHQGFRVGETAWGVQFHPEATPSMVRRWADQDARAVAEAGDDPDALAQAAVDGWADQERVFAPLAGRFARAVQDAADRASKVSSRPSSGGL